MTGGTCIVPLTLAFSELAIILRIPSLAPRCVVNIAKTQLFVDEEIAGIDVSVVLDDKILPAVLSHGTNVCDAVDQFNQHAIEVANGHLQRIGVEPLVEQFTKKIAPLATRDCEGQRIAFGIELHTRDVLLVKEALVGKIAVDFTCSVDVGLAYQHQNIELNTVTPERLDSPHHVGVRRTTAVSHAKVIVNLGGTIETAPKKKSKVSQMLCEFIIDQRRVGLQSIGNDGALLAEFGLKMGNTPKKVDSHQRWLTTLPGKRIGGLFRRHVAFHDPFQHRFSHPVTTSRFAIELRFLEVKAILAT